MRIRRALLTASIVALAAAQTASAAVAPTFSRGRARVGDTVVVYQPGGLSWLEGSRRDRPIRIYLVGAPLVTRVIGAAGSPRTGPPPSFARYVGTWSRAGRVAFRVPHVRPGRYAAVAWCLPCGGTLIASVPWSVPDGVGLRDRGALLTVRR